MPTLTIRDAIRTAIDDAMTQDERVIFLGQDIGVYGGAFGVSRGLLAKFGEDRIVETPISENSTVGVAVGASMKGYRVIVEIMFQDFVTLAMDQIVNHAAKIHYMYAGQLTIPITIRLVSGGGRGYGASHSQTLDSWFMHVPGLRVVAPSNPTDAYRLLRSSIQSPDPVIFIENKLLYDVKGEFANGDSLHPIQGAEIVRRGKDVTVVTYGRMVHLSLEAAALAELENIAVEVVDLRVLQPLDRATIVASVQRTGKAVVVEEGCRTAGVGAEVAAVIVEDCVEYLDGRVLRVAGENCPIPSSSKLEKVVLPDVSRILEAIRQTRLA